MMRRLGMAAIVVMLVGGGVAVGAALDDPDPRPVSRVERYYPAGPSADYDGDGGGIGSVPATRVRVPSGAHDAVVTVSFEYTARGPGPFEISVAASRGSNTVRALPRRTLLAPASPSTTTTARFVLRGLAGGQTYDVMPSVNSVFTEGRNSIRTRRMVVTVELTAG